MIAVKQAPDRRTPILWLDAALAALAAVAYVLIGLGALAVGDLAPAEQPAAIIYVAAASYLLGGLLLFARRRWLWVVGAMVNALVILAFVLAYRDRPEVMFSPGGIVTKVPQLLLEAGLIALIVADWLRARRAA